LISPKATTRDFSAANFVPLGNPVPPLTGAITNILEYKGFRLDFTFQGVSGNKIELLLEEALVRHPKLRIYIMHAGWPMIDDLIALLWEYSQVYVDVGTICYAIPRPEFYLYLKRIVEAGFGKRVMYGSDQMNRPCAIEAGI
jgi:predicted TIM-barrel fold metal-dependent hydrolase